MKKPTEKLKPGPHNIRWDLGKLLLATKGTKIYNRIYVSKLLLERGNIDAEQETREQLFRTVGGAMLKHIAVDRTHPVVVASQGFTRTPLDSECGYELALDVFDLRDVADGIKAESEVGR